MTEAALSNPQKAEGIRPYYPALDGLRACSVFLVINAHTLGRPGFLFYIPGWLGVDVFFALSGFLITILLLKEYEAFDRVSMRAFYLRRVFRILPVYFCVLAIYVVLNAHRGGEGWMQLKHALPLYFTFLNEFTHAPFDFTWTLGIEEKFYLLWPLLGFVLFPRKRLLVASLVYILLLAMMPLSLQTSRCYSGLLLGCILAIVLQGPYAAKVVRRLAKTPILFPLILVGLCCYFASSHPKAVFFFDPAMILLIAHLLSKRSVLTRLLSSAPLVWIGKRSYSMYLVHGLCLGFVQGYFLPVSAPQHLLIALTVTGCAVCFAHVLYLAIEQPARAMGKRVIAHSATA